MKKTFQLKWGGSEDLCYLYLDDQSLVHYQLIDHAKNVKFIKSPSHVVLWNKDAKIKTLYGIQHDEIFKVILPKESPIEVINDICIFEENGLWYTMKFDKGAWQRLVLGKKFEKRLNSASEIYKFECTSWKYFLKEEPNNTVKLYHFAKKKLCFLGSYFEVVETNQARIIALRSDELYDMFSPDSCSPIEGKEGETFCAWRGIFVWSKDQNGWIFHPNCSLWANNAAYRILGDYGEKIELYRFDGKNFHLVTKGRWYWTSGASALCIEGMKYTLNIKTGSVNLDTPKPTIEKRIKDFLNRF